jgi:thiol-disulfide isomerase/thioredoxin
MLGAWLLGWAACGPIFSETVVLSLSGIDCATCGAQAIAQLKKNTGVGQAKFDFKTAELNVSYDPSLVTAPALVALVKAGGLGVELGAGKGTYLELPTFNLGLDVVEIVRSGEAVDVEAHTVPGKVTVFDFYAVWCGPCREVQEELKVQIASRNDLAIRKLNVVDWDSPIAKRYLATTPELPLVMVYDKRGKRIATIPGLDLNGLRTAIQTAGGL